MKAASVAIGICLFLFIMPTSEASPLIGASANTLPGGSFMVDGLFWYMNFDQHYYNEEWVDLGGSDSFKKAIFLSRFYYGIADGLTIRLTVPLITQTKKDDGQRDESTGIGDLVIDPKMCLLRGGGGIPKISWFAGIRIPTGDDEVIPALGDGSTDYLIGILLTQSWGSLAGHGTLGLWVNGKGSNHKELPDQTFYNLTIEHPLSSKWIAACELNGSITGNGPFAHDEYLLEICPEVQFKSVTGLTLGGALKVPMAAKGGYRYRCAPFVGAVYLFPKG